MLRPSYASQRYRYVCIVAFLLVFTCFCCQNSIGDEVSFFAVDAPDANVDAFSSQGSSLDFWRWSDVDGCDFCSPGNGGSAHNGGGDIAVWGLTAVGSGQYSEMSNDDLTSIITRSLAEASDSIEIQFGHSDVQSGGAVGVEFLSRSIVQTSFQFNGSDDPESGSFYSVTDQTTSDTDMEATEDQFTLRVTLLDEDGGYRMDFGSKSHTGTLFSGQSHINGIRVFNMASGSVVQSNNLMVSLSASAVPEPGGAFAVLGIVGCLIRRKRPV